MLSDKTIEFENVSVVFVFYGSAQRWKKFETAESTTFSIIGAF
jgi:hypothetical protein